MGRKTKPGWKLWKPPPDKRGRWERWERWGLRGKTVWDWLQLLVVPVMVALVAGVFTTLQIFFQIAEEAARQQAITDQTAKFQRVLEEFRVQEASEQAYLDLMATLLLEHNLRESAEGSEVRAIAQAQTLATLKKQDAEGKSTVVQFLIDAGLLQASPSDGRGEAVIRLAGVDLRHANLSDANLSNVDLSHADLSNANLEQADLSNADLSNADLSGSRWFGGGTNLRGADLSDADLSRANLEQADLSNAKGMSNKDLEQQASSLKDATMPNGQKYEDWLKSKDRKENGKSGGSS